MHDITKYSGRMRRQDYQKVVPKEQKNKEDAEAEKKRKANP